MTIKIKKTFINKVLRATQIALLGAVVQNMRVIWVAFPNINEVEIHCCFYERPTDEEIEEINCVETEVMCFLPEHIKVNHFWHYSPANEIFHYHLLEPHIKSFAVYKAKELSKTI